MLNINGIVPKPKKVINKIPLYILPVAMAPAIAMYTKPQGNNPFNNPIVNND